MKDFEFAKKVKRHRNIIPRIKTENYDISVLILPVAPFLIAIDKFNMWRYNRRVWDEKKATKVLNYFLPYVLEYDEADDAYYYYLEWYTDRRSIAKKVPLRLRKWTRKFGFEIIRFLINGYEKSGFTKTIVNDSGSWVKFVKNT